MWREAEQDGPRHSETAVKRARGRAAARGRPISTADVVRAYLVAHFAYPAPDHTTATYTEPRRWLREHSAGPRWAEHRTLVRAWGQAQARTGPPWREWCRSRNKSETSSRDMPS